MMITNARESPAKRAHKLLSSLNCDGRYGLTLLAGLGFLGLLAAGGPPWAARLQYERTSIGAGEWWRLVTAHWVHLGARHLLLDAAGLVLLWALYARELRARTWLLVLAGATGVIDAGLWWGQPQLQWYLGLSGLLHAFWSAGAAGAALRRNALGYLMLAILATKLAVEQYRGGSVVTEAFPVVSASHWYGAVGGLVVIAALALRRKPL
ncbi:MAG TPA: rhombosortase [Steroidobacteraceae bacterium]|nr:rhombosortase [Steroidobacteraceae bacterium]